MVNPKKTNELKCLLCAIEECRTSFPMRDSEKDNKLFSLINVELQLQAAIDSKKFTLRYLFSLVCLSCRDVLRSIYEFRMRSVQSCNQLRMKFVNSSPDQQQATSSAQADGWIKIVSVVSQSDRDDNGRRNATRRRSTRSSSRTNGAVNGDTVNGAKSDSHSDCSSRKRGCYNGYGVRTRRQKSSDKDYRYSTDDYEVTPYDQWHDDTDEHCGNHEPMDVFDNEICQINYAVQDQNPEISSTNIVSPEIIPCDSSEEDVGHKTPIDKPVDNFIDIPEMPECHPPYLQVLYSTEVESALETESGGRINKQNDEITSAFKRKSVTCSFCHKTMKNQLALSRHMITTHFHDKRKAIKDHREQKAADKSYVCDTCHSQFNTSRMLKKHVKSHNRMVCEVCKAEYLNKMDFDWHRAQCSGENRSSCTVPGAWTRARSRHSRVTAAETQKTNEPILPTPDVNLETKSNVNFELTQDVTLDTTQDINLDSTQDVDLESTPAVYVETDVIPVDVDTERPSSALSQIHKDKQLVKWIEESKMRIKLDQVEPVPRSVRPKKTRKSRKRKRSAPARVRQSRKQGAISDNDEEVRDISTESQGRSRSFRASTPFPTRRRSSFSSAVSFTTSRPLSRASLNTTNTNLDSWIQYISDIDDNYDDNASVYSGFTSISSSARSDITARTGISNQSGRSRRTRGHSRAMSQVSCRTVESITSCISKLTSKPQTRRVANQLKKLELELSFSQSRANSTQSTTHRRFRRHPYFERRAADISLFCNEAECMDQPAFDTLDNLMDHQTEMHKILRLYRCGECKAKFTQKNFLQLHKATHNPGPYMCNMCDSSLEHEWDLRHHYDLHAMKSLPCDYCHKIFLREADKTQHLLIFHHREMNSQNEVDFVEGFLRQRVLAGGLPTIGGQRVRPKKKTIRRNSSRTSVDVEAQTRYSKLLATMHGSSVPLRSSPVPGCSKECDTADLTCNITDLTCDSPDDACATSENMHAQRESHTDEVSVGKGICDTIINSDTEDVNPMTPPGFTELDANVNAMSVEDIGSEFEHVSTRSSVGTREPRIELIVKRRRSKHVMPLELLDDDTPSLKLFCYRDVNKNKSPVNSVVESDKQKPKPWRV